MKERAGFAGKTLLTYFPTYRGIFNQVERQEYMETLSANLALWDRQLKDDEVLLDQIASFPSWFLKLLTVTVISALSRPTGIPMKA